LGNGFTYELTTKFGKCEETVPFADSSEKKFTLELTTDEWGGETSFLVKRRNANGKFKTKVFTGNKFACSTDCTRTKCLSQSGCYKLIVKDSASDGVYAVLMEMVLSKDIGKGKKFRIRTLKSQMGRRPRHYWTN
jgi:hypothetical protein